MTGKYSATIISEEFSFLFLVRRCDTFVYLFCYFRTHVRICGVTEKYS